MAAKYRADENAIWSTAHDFIAKETAIITKPDMPDAPENDRSDLRVPARP